MRIFKYALILLSGLWASAASTQSSISPARSAPAAPIAAKALDEADLAAWLDGYMPYALKRSDVAGAVVVVVRNGQVLAQRGYGYADVARRTPVDPATTIFRPGSISKLITWTAVMQLVEQGKLDLDRDVNAYIDFVIPPRDGRPITLRQLMTHSAGFEETAKGVIVEQTRNIMPLGAYLKQRMPRRIFGPRETPAYSNYGAGLAGYIVERISGLSYDDYVERHIFGPLQMTRSSFRQPFPGHLRPMLSKGYELASGEARPIEFVNPAPAGALAATGADMARFMIAHLNGGGPLLRPETTRLMHDSKLTILPSVNRMALGFYEQNINGHNVIAHGGDTSWFHSFMWLFPDDNVGIFISVNSAGKDYSPGRILVDFADRYFPAPLPVAGVDPATAARHAAMLAGTYIGSRRWETGFLKALELSSQLTIGHDGKGGLLFPGRTTKWIEVAPFVWRSEDGHEKIAAKVANGEITRIGFDAAPYKVFDRAPWYRSTAWLLPVFGVSLIILIISAILWPIAALVRRHYGVKLALTGADLRAHRLVRALTAAAVIALLLWNGMALLLLLKADAANAGSLDPAALAVQAATSLILIALTVAAFWQMWRLWARRDGWFARLSSVITLIAAITVLWAGLVFNIIGFGTDF